MVPALLSVLLTGALAVGLSVLLLGHGQVIPSGVGELEVLVVGLCFAAVLTLTCSVLGGLAAHTRAVGVWPALLPDVFGPQPGMVDHNDPDKED